MTRDELLAVLQNGDFEQLIGVREGLEVEFKRQPYQLDQEAEKFELAKDISAMANAEGGVIVIGVETERREEAPVDEAVRIRDFERGLVDEARYVAVATERIYPRIQRLRVEFRSRADDEARGIVAIDVPQQDDNDKLFLVQRPVAEGTAVPGWLVAVAVRSFGRVDERRVGEIHGLVTRGYNISTRLDELAGEIALIRDRLEAGVVVPQPEAPADRVLDVIERRIAELEDEAGEEP